LRGFNNASLFMTTIDAILARIGLRKPSIKAAGVKKFGTFEGVFLPTLLTILGAVMYLRTGWIVGNAGLAGAWLIILIANMITFCTGLSISTVATNIRVGAGGSFSIISQSLGLEVGGSVNVPFYLAQSISVAFYIFAFTEGWLSIFPTHTELLVLLTVFLVCSAIAFISVGLAARIRYPILFIVSFSLFSVFLGSFPRFGNPGAIYSPELIGAFPSGSFWEIFAVFFPAVTGVLAGVNLSGTLAHPRRSIPLGTMSAVVVSFLVYMSLAYWSSRVATPAELVGNFTIMVDKAAFGWAVQAGILAATFSAALNSLVGAPRILQAMAKHDVVPFSSWLAHEYGGEPRPAMYVTGVIAFVTLLFGLSGNGLNKIAPLMTMFFLITYAVLNTVVVMEQSMQLTSFRPLLKIPSIVPVIGLLGSLVAMFLIAPIFSLAAIVTVILMYEALQLRQLGTPWSDVRSGLFGSIAEWAAKRTLSMPGGRDRAWKPSLLVPVVSAAAIRRSYRFLTAITRPNGSIHIVGVHSSEQSKRVTGLPAYEEIFAGEGIFCRVALVESHDSVQTLQTTMEVFRSAFFRPNILFLSVNAGTDADDLPRILAHAAANELAVILYMDNPLTALGREQVLNVWIREQSPEWNVGLELSNLDLALLLAYQLARNWNAQINLITVLRDPADRPAGEEFLNQLVELGRMPGTTRTIVVDGDFTDYLPEAPQADLNIFGLQATVSLAFMEEMIEATASTCVFVRDSGLESALA
jgi:solute carrier family 12 sodium/potassium/chloride transporter 2